MSHLVDTLICRIFKLLVGTLVFHIPVGSSSTLLKPEIKASVLITVSSAFLPRRNDYDLPLRSSPGRLPYLV